MSDPPPRERVCWNCDQPVERVIHAALVVPQSTRLPVPLCPPCHTFHYVPLMRGPTAHDREGDASSNILVVDDDPALLTALSMALESEGYRVDTAGTGEEALMKVWDSLPGVIVLDVHIPAMTGLGLLKVLRHMLPERPVPVVMMTGGDPVPEIGHQGADAFLRKPFTLDALVEVVRDLTNSPMAE